MTKRIFRSICLVAIAVFLASAALFMSVLYDYFSSVQKTQLKSQVELAAAGVSESGMDYFEDLHLNNARITWIAENGEVRYDSDRDADEMENHLEREEIKGALENGYGESARYSATLLEKSLYSAKRLPDGSVLRMSVRQNSLLTLLMGMLLPVGIIFAIAVVLSLVLAYRLSKRIVKPLNELNLENPLENDGYEELSPLLSRLHRQQQQIQSQSEELKRKQEEFDTVTGNMAEGILLLNAKGGILSINKTAQRLFQTDAACIGKYLLEVDRRPELSDLVGEAAKGNHAEKIVDFASGRYQLDVSPVLSNGMVSGAVLLAMDVTAKEQAEQMRREFTANVSHELKTPLQIISGHAELLAGGIVKEENRQEFAGQIYSEAQRMIRLVEDIIRLSHLDEGAEDLKREKTNLYHLAGEVVGQLSEEAKKADVTLALQGEDAEILGIPRILHEIVYNLCDNGMKYNKPGGSVTVTVENRESVAVITVADTGIGIPPEHQKRIFERFYRVDKSRSKELGGTGLGLSIVKHGVQLHGGEISLSSTPDVGTTITVTFPKDFAAKQG